jgi:hypothetical protein
MSWAAEPTLAGSTAISPNSAVRLPRSARSLLSSKGLDPRDRIGDNHSSRDTRTDTEQKPSQGCLRPRCMQTRKAARSPRHLSRRDPCCSAAVTGRRFGVGACRPFVCCLVQRRRLHRCPARLSGAADDLAADSSTGPTGGGPDPRTSVRLRSAGGPMVFRAVGVRARKFLAHFVDSRRAT